MSLILHPTGGDKERGKELRRALKLDQFLVRDQTQDRNFRHGWVHFDEDLEEAWKRGRRLPHKTIRDKHEHRLGYGIKSIAMEDFTITLPQRQQAFVTGYYLDAAEEVGKRTEWGLRDIDIWEG